MARTLPAPHEVIEGHLLVAGRFDCAPDTLAQALVLAERQHPCSAGLKLRLHVAVQHDARAQLNTYDPRCLRIETRAQRRKGWSQCQHRCANAG